MLNAGDRVTYENWRELFADFDPIFVIANSEAQTLQTLYAEAPESALFVFFNRADRLLPDVFHGKSLLVTRSNQAGSELVYRGQLDLVAKSFDPQTFLGFMNLKVADFETLQRIEDFGNYPAGTLDLSGYLADFYPPDHTASSGFALAAWLSEMSRRQKVVLSGFSGLRSEDRKVFLVHDWTFEQTALRVLKDCGRLSFAEPSSENRYRGFLRHFPDTGDPNLLLAAIETLATRLENAERMIDRLMSVTAPQRRLSTWLKSIRPKTRKQKILDKRANEKQ